MSNANKGKLCCRHCRYYKSCGQCQMLGVPVRGVWPAELLLVSPFAPSWEEPSARQPFPYIAWRKREQSSSDDRES